MPEPKERGNARVRIASHEVDLPASRIPMDPAHGGASLFKVGDLIEVEVRELDGNVPTDARSRAVAARRGSVARN